MKILLQYLKPFKWLVIFTLVLAAINISFSLIDPIIFGKLIDLGYRYALNDELFKPFWWNFAGPLLTLLGASVGVLCSLCICCNCGAGTTTLEG